MTTHNSFVNRPEGWILYQQAQSIDEQLRAGIRAFMVDPWLAKIHGDEDIYLLHEGWTLQWLFPHSSFQKLSAFLQKVVDFLEAPGNENEIVTVFFDTPSRTKSNTRKQEGIDKMKAILKPFRDKLFYPDKITNGLKSTLREIVADRRRLLILSDNRELTDQHSLKKRDLYDLPLVWHYCTETIYGDRSLDPNTWVEERAESADSQSPDRVLGLLNHYPDWAAGHFLLNFDPADQDTLERFLERYFRRANGKLLLESHAISYRETFGVAPNFVSLDMVTVGTGPTDIVAYCDAIRRQPKTIVSILGINNEFMVAPDGIANNSLIYCQSGTPLEFEVIGTFEHCVMKLAAPASSEDLYLNYRDLSGAVKLYDDKSDANFKIEAIGNETYKIYSIDCDQYMWASPFNDDFEPYIRRVAEEGWGYNFWQLRINGADPATKEVEIHELATSNKHFMTAESGLENDSLIYCRFNLPLTFEMIGPESNCVLRLKGSALFLSCRELSGAVKLYDKWEVQPVTQKISLSNYKIEEVETGQYSIYSLVYEQYMGLDGDEPYITGSADPTNREGRWGIVHPSERKKFFEVVKIRSAENGEYMRVDELDNNELIYCDPGLAKVLEFVETPEPTSVFVVPNRQLFLNYRDLGGKVKLYDESTGFLVQELGSDRISLRSTEKNMQYMWLSDAEPYIDSEGDPNKTSGQWIIESRVV